jgi:phage protein U
VQWTGSERGQISGVAAAEWCGLQKLLEIRTVQGDTGIELALYPGKTVVAGAYRVMDPVKAESVPPAAGVALRWVTQTAVQGFQGDSGTVHLRRSNSGRFSGNVSAHARSVIDTQRVYIKGTFDDLTLERAGRGCTAPAARRAEDAEPRPTGVH